MRYACFKKLINTKEYHIRKDWEKTEPFILNRLKDKLYVNKTKGDPLGWQRAGYMRGIGGKNYFLRLI